MTLHVSIDLDEAQKAELDRIARHENISLEALVARLVEGRLEYDRWFRAEVQKGVDSAARGEILEEDEVFRQIEARLAARSAAAE